FSLKLTAKFECCHSPGYVNSFDNPLDFKCPGDKFVTGVSGYHDNHFEDRRYGFQCCNILGRSPRDCYLTGEVNTWDGKLTLVVGEGKAIKGAHSVHNNYYEDRIWKFEICSI
ncbi:unnamed protein product, partial [Lymnaea stagnalis]